MSQLIFYGLQALLQRHQAQYKIIKHTTARTVYETAIARGTDITQGAKSLVCHIKGSPTHQYVLAVLPSDQQLNLLKLAHSVAGTHAALASPREVKKLTRCVFGAIPPFSFHPCLHLMVSPSLGYHHKMIVFNAGLLTYSILLSKTDYFHIIAAQTNTVLCD